MNAKEIAKSYEEQLVGYRRHLHRHPELSFQETETAAFIREKLAELAIPVLEGVRGNSTVGILKGEKPGPVLLFRADIDALPVMEESGVEFASEVPGVMHACGHDAHTATLLCFADYMAKHREEICGTVKFAFQQGEDMVPGGGKLLVEDGVVDDVDYAFGWHCSPENTLGEVVCAGGPRTASFDSVEITVRGRGGHAGFPFRAVDPVSTAALIVTAMNQLINWTVNPLDAATLIISHVNTGIHGVYNVVPEQTVIEANIRSLNNEAAARMRERVCEIVEGICQAKGCSYEVKVLPGYPALSNDEEAAARVRSALLERGVNAVVRPPIMGAEDFASYLQKCPGIYFNVGSSRPGDPATMWAPHNPHFRIDEEVMQRALETLLITYEEMTK